MDIFLGKARHDQGLFYSIFNVIAFPSIKIKMAPISFAEK